MAEVARPPSVPAEGQIEAFDAGWDAQEVGLDRETVAVLAHPSGRSWALLGWDSRALASGAHTAEQLQAARRKVA